jgi:hypothetical protein
VLEAFVLLAGVVVLLGDVYACRVLDRRRRVKRRERVIRLERELDYAAQRLDMQRLDATKEHYRRVFHERIGLAREDLEALDA